MGTAQPACTDRNVVLVRSSISCSQSRTDLNMPAQIGKKLPFDAVPFFFPCVGPLGIWLATGSSQEGEFGVSRPLTMRTAGPFCVTAEKFGYVDMERRARWPFCYP